VSSWRLYSADRGRGSRARSCIRRASRRLSCEHRVRPGQQRCDRLLRPAWAALGAPTTCARVIGQSAHLERSPDGGESVRPRAIRRFARSDHDNDAQGDGGFYTDDFHGRWMRYRARTPQRVFV